jgi:DNA-binding PadR family transcriptional regulator
VADRSFSSQTLSVLGALEADPSSWRHGYAIAKETGLRSGTLYPVLIRLAERDLVEACWEDVQPAGRPRRHLYRLTPDGLVAAREALAAAARSPLSRKTSTRQRLIATMDT